MHSIVSNDKTPKQLILMLTALSNPVSVEILVPTIDRISEDILATMSTDRLQKFLSAEQNVQIPWDALPMLTTLEAMKLAQPMPSNLSMLTSLQSLTVGWPAVPQSSDPCLFEQDVQQWPPNLRKLSIMEYDAGLGTTGAPGSAHCNIHLNGLDNLANLAISAVAHSNFTVVSLPPNVVEISLASSDGSYVYLDWKDDTPSQPLFPSSLLSLTLEGIQMSDNDFDSEYAVQERTNLWWPKSLSTSTPYLGNLRIFRCLIPTLPDLSDTNLRSLDVQLMYWQPNNFESIFCRLSSTSTPLNPKSSLPLSKLETLIISSTAISGEWAYPTCFAEFSKLTTLQAQGDFGFYTYFETLPSSLTTINFNAMNLETSVPPSFDWHKFARHFPLLKVLQVRHRAPSSAMDFPYDAIYRWYDSLQVLVLTGAKFTGKIPKSFFVRMPRLRTLTMTGSQLEGDVPYIGLGTVEELRLSGNKFENWPSLIGAAPNLRIIDFSENLELKSIPDDISFGNMDNLQYLDMSGCLELKGPIPNVFRTSSRVRRLTVSRSAFDGPFPVSTILNPNLEMLEAAGNNICGPLPEIVNNMPTGEPHLFAPSRLYHVDLAANKLEGTVPESFGNIFCSRLDLSSNIGIHGSLPPSLCKPTPALASTINLDDIPSLTGDMFDAKFLGNFSTVSLRESLVFQCANVTSDLYSNKRINCFYSGSPCTYCAACFALHCGNPTMIGTPTNTELDPTSPLSGACQPSVIRAPAISFACEQPTPGTGFQCIDGEWVFPGDIVVPSLVLPSGVTTVVGNLNTTGLVFSGLFSQISISGCANIGTEGVTIRLSAQDIDRIVKSGGTLTTNLILSNGSSCSGTDLSLVSLTVRQPDDCKKVTVKQATPRGSPGRLTAIFSVDSSACNKKKSSSTWWIILVAVLGGFLLLTVIAILLVVFVPGLKNAIRPYRRRKATAK